MASNDDLRLVFGDIAITLDLPPLVWAPTGFARTMAQHLAAVIEPGDRVLELGLGSGVLAILAAKLGAAAVTGLDINDQAIATATRNWAANGLEPAAADFRHADLFGGLSAADHGRFDLIVSNPPVLPMLDAAPAPRAPASRDDFEIAGRDGRRVLDAVIGSGGRFVKPGGRLLTIATSLQGWPETEALLAAHWQRWEIRQTLAMELTEECTPPFLAYWQDRTRADGRRRVYRDGDRWLHDVWFVCARDPMERSDHAGSPASDRRDPAGAADPSGVSAPDRPDRPAGSP